MNSPKLLDLSTGLGGKGSQSFSCSKIKLDSLFVQWFSLPSSQQLVRCRCRAGLGGASTSCVYELERTPPPGAGPQAPGRGQGWSLGVTWLSQQKGVAGSLVRARPRLYGLHGRRGWGLWWPATSVNWDAGCSSMSRKLLVPNKTDQAKEHDAFKRVPILAVRLCVQPPLSPRKSGGISSPFSVSPGTHNATKLVSRGCDVVLGSGRCHV